MINPPALTYHDTHVRIGQRSGLRMLNLRPFDVVHSHALQRLGPHHSSTAPLPTLSPVICSSLRSPAWIWDFDHCQSFPSLLWLTMSKHKLVRAKISRLDEAHGMPIRVFQQTMPTSLLSLGRS